MKVLSAWRICHWEASKLAPLCQPEELDSNDNKTLLMAESSIITQVEKEECQQLKSNGSNAPAVSDQGKIFSFSDSAPGQCVPYLHSLIGPALPRFFSTIQHVS